MSAHQGIRTAPHPIQKQGIDLGPINQKIERSGSGTIKVELRTMSGFDSRLFHHRSGIIYKITMFFRMIPEPLIIAHLAAQSP